MKWSGHANVFHIWVLKIPTKTHIYLGYQRCNKRNYLILNIIHNILNSSDTEFDQRDASDAKSNESTNTKQTKPNVLKVGQKEHVKSSFPV